MNYAYIAFINAYVFDTSNNVEMLLWLCFEVNCVVLSYSSLQANICNVDILYLSSSYLDRQGHHFWRDVAEIAIHKASLWRFTTP